MSNLRGGTDEDAGSFDAAAEKVAFERVILRLRVDEDGVSKINVPRCPLLLVSDCHALVWFWDLLHSVIY